MPVKTPRSSAGSKYDLRSHERITGLHSKQTQELACASSAVVQKSPGDCLTPAPCKARMTGDADVSLGQLGGLATADCIVPSMSTKVNVYGS